MRTRISVLLIPLLLVAATNASAMTITYKLGQKRIGHWSGSYLHEASGCTALDMGTSGSNDTLHLCGGARAASGSIPGNLNSLSPLETPRRGRIFFARMPIDRITANALTHWRQNLLTYTRRPCEGCRSQDGIDLHGEGLALREPGSLWVALLGLILMPLVMRRRHLADLRSQ